MGRINIEEIDSESIRILCSTFLKAIEKFYDDPKNREAYKLWEAAKEKSK